jgi:hypothetical protein
MQTLFIAIKLDAISLFSDEQCEVFLQKIVFAFAVILFILIVLKVFSLPVFIPPQPT